MLDGGILRLPSGIAAAFASVGSKWSAGHFSKKNSVLRGVLSLFQESVTGCRSNAPFDCNVLGRAMCVESGFDGVANGSLTAADYALIISVIKGEKRHLFAAKVLFCVLPFENY